MQQRVTSSVSPTNNATAEQQLITDVSAFMSPINVALNSEMTGSQHDGRRASLNT